MDDSDVIVSSTEIIKDTLYFATLQNKYRPRATRNSKYFHIEDDLVYESFYLDYGPYNLCNLYFFCKKLNDKLAKVPKTKKIVFFTSDDSILRLNAAYLIGSYSIIYLNMTAKAAYEVVTEGSHWDLLTFRDASAGSPLFEITLQDVFQGLEKAFSGGFFDFNNFDCVEYMFYEKVLNGDLNWIIPDKMLAFSGPHSQSRIKDDYPQHAPDHYHQYFKENNVTTIVRLNQKAYSAKQFTDFGFEHHELFFLDGSAPSDAIVEKFIKICEAAKGAVAVHCKAGLGRTGTLIACYMMKHHGFTARQAISWLRICRPGSVIGFQQNFLQHAQQKLLQEGMIYRRQRKIYDLPKFKHGIYSKTVAANSEDVENANFIESNSNLSLDDLENVPAKKTTCRNAKTNIDSGTSNKQNKNDFVSLDSIINCNQLNVPETRMPKTRISTTLGNVKNSCKPAATNYKIPNPTVPKLVSYLPKSLKSSSNAYSKPSFCSTIIFGISPAKMSIAKTQHTKSSIHSPRVNLAKNHGQTYSHSAGPLKTYLRKPSNTVKVPSTSTNMKSSNTFANSSTSSAKDYESNLSLIAEAPKKVVVSVNSATSKLNDNTKKKVVLRKKPLKVGSVDLKNCNISNSDSEKDSTNTTLTNISADSLENIPCKMVTRRDKSKSSEHMHHIPENMNNGDIEEGAESQGSKLCKIKASRKKVATLSVATRKKDGMKTRNYTNPSAVKKK